MKIDTILKGPTTYFQPTREIDQDSPEAELLRRLATLVGLIAFLLPVILLIGVWRESCFRDSISHFYYAQFLGSVFVGLLVFIGGFLIAYRGESDFENWGSFVAGLGACFVAVFPTTGDGCEKLDVFKSRVFVQYERGAEIPTPHVEGRDYFQLFANVDDLHAWAAGALFLFLAAYCYFVLARTVPKRHLENGGKLRPAKRKRNIIYRLCGLTIFVCVATLFIVSRQSPEAIKQWNSWNGTFFFETVALWAFGIAWVVKGRGFGRMKSLYD